MKVKAKVNVEDKESGDKEEKNVEVEYDFGEDLASMEKLFTDKIVHAHARANMVVSLQSYIRGLVKQGKTGKDLQDTVAAWKPSMREPGKAAVDRIAESVDKLTPEERAALIKQLREDTKKG